MNNIELRNDFYLVKPSEVIFYAIDKAVERTEAMKTQEFGIVGGHIFHHPELDKEIDKYIERLLATQRNNLLAELLREMAPKKYKVYPEQHYCFNDALDQVTALIKSKMEEK